MLCEVIKGQEDKDMCPGGSKHGFRPVTRKDHGTIRGRGRQWNKVEESWGERVQCSGEGGRQMR